MPKRIAIYVFYDKYGVVDDYVTYFLSRLRNVTDYCIFVSQIKLCDAEKQKVNKFAEEIICRENIGFDAGAIKDVLINYAGKEIIASYDELVLVNDSIYGPFYDLNKCFEKMEKYDFWGMTRNGGSGTVPFHLQSYFLVINKKMLHSEDFYSYWEQMEYYESFEEVLQNYEFGFTKYFSERGYSWKSYVDSSKWEVGTPRFPINPYYQILNESLQYEQFPFLKRKPFSYCNNFLALDRFSRYSFKFALKYIEDKNLYPMELVWENLIRTYPANQLFYNCNLRFIVGDECESNDEKYAVIIKGLSPIFEEQFKRWYFPMCQNVDFYFFSKDPQDKYQKNIFYASVDKIDWHTVFQKWIHDHNKSYKYLCCIDGEVFSESNGFYSDLESVFLSRFENLIASSGYANAVCRKFKSNKNVGMLFAPDLQTGTTFSYFGQLSDEHKRELQLIHDTLFSMVPYSDKDRCISLSRSFWIETSLLNRINEKIQKYVNKIDDAVYCQMLVLAIQSLGKYTGIIENQNYSEYEITNVNYLLDSAKEIIARADSFSDSEAFLRIIKDDISDKVRINRFICTHSEIYIYGAGKKARELGGRIQDYKGFVVTNKEDNPDNLMGKKVVEISNLEICHNTGFVIAVSARFITDIENKLIELGCDKDQYIIY